MARRKNSEWYVGAVTKDPRDIKVSFNFLQDGVYSCEIYSDGPDFPNSVKQEIIEIGPDSKMVVHLVYGGGMVMQINKK